MSGSRAFGELERVAAEIDYSVEESNYTFALATTRQRTKPHFRLLANHPGRKSVDGGSDYGTAEIAKPPNPDRTQYSTLNSIWAQSRRAAFDLERWLSPDDRFWKGTSISEGPQWARNQTLEA